MAKHVSMKCLLMKHDIVVARVIADDLVVVEQDDGYAIDLEGENADLMMHGDTPTDVLFDVAESLCWYAHRTVTKGEPFPEYDGVVFDSPSQDPDVLPCGDDDDYDFMTNLPSLKGADLVHA